MEKQIKVCITCKSSFERPKDLSNFLWEKRKYCSLPCYRKVPRSEEIRQRISASCKQRGIGKWMIGRVRPIELRVKHSKQMKEIVASGKHNFWKGGVSKQNRNFKSNFQNTLEYRLWRTAVFERDEYACVWCGDSKSGNLQADHIKEFAKFPELRLDVDNGRTLCRGCHYKRHSKSQWQLSPTP